MSPAASPQSISWNEPFEQRAKLDPMQAVSPSSQVLSCERVWNCPFSFCASSPFWRRKFEDEGEDEEAATLPVALPDDAPEDGASHVGTSVDDVTAGSDAVSVTVSAALVAVSTVFAEPVSLELLPELELLEPPDELALLQKHQVSQICAEANRIELT